MFSPILKRAPVLAAAIGAVALGATLTVAAPVSAEEPTQATTVTADVAAIRTADASASRVAGHHATHADGTLAISVWRPGPVIPAGAEETGATNALFSGSASEITVLAEDGQFTHSLVIDAFDFDWPMIREPVTVEVQGHYDVQHPDSASAATFDSATVTRTEAGYEIATPYGTVAFS